MSFFLVFSICIFGGFNFSEAHKAPALYVLGDALVDVGNNNHLTFSFNKANFPHHGIDFHNKEAIGRFDNSKILRIFLVTSQPCMTRNIYSTFFSSKQSRSHNMLEDFNCINFLFGLYGMLQLRKLACQLHHRIFP